MLRLFFIFLFFALSAASAAAQIIEAPVKYNICPDGDDQFEQLAILRVNELEAWPLAKSEVDQLSRLYSSCGVPIFAIKLIERSLQDEVVKATAMTHILLSKLYFEARNQTEGFNELEKAVLFGSDETNFHVARLFNAVDYSNPRNASNCAQQERIILASSEAGLNTGREWRWIADCRYWATQEFEKPDIEQYCSRRRSFRAKFRKRYNSKIKEKQIKAQKPLPYANYEETPYVLGMSYALEAFKKLLISSTPDEDDLKWKKFVATELQRLQRLCKFHRDIRHQPIYLGVIEYE